MKEPKKCKECGCPYVDGRPFCECKEIGTRTSGKCDQCYQWGSVTVMSAALGGTRKVCDKCKAK